MSPVAELTELVAKTANEHGDRVEIGHFENPHVEMDELYYNPKHAKLAELGLKPRLLSQVLLKQMNQYIAKLRDRIDTSTLASWVSWRFT